MTYKTITNKLIDLDYSAIIVITAISTIGFAMLYSAAGGSFEPWAIRQIVRYFVGIVFLVSIAMMDIRFWRSLSYVCYLSSLLLLVFVEFKGHIGMGAQRWIDLYIITIQPSELMKITLVMALANYFHTINSHDISRLRTYIIPLFLIAVPALLVLRQPNLGTMFILIITGASIIFVAGLPFWMVLSASVIVMAGLPILWSQMHSYQKQRVLSFLNPESDPLGASYNIIQSKIAIGSGGFWGKGFLQGSQGQLNFLPVIQTDFIFAMLCEEFGVLGGLFLICLYIILIIYGYRVSFESKNLYGRLMGVGITTLFFLYVFINMAMVMGLLPVVGVPLPFMSWGGTSMLSLMIGFGLLMSTSLCKSVRFGRHY
jgi:rod shape determining protein RodA